MADDNAADDEQKQYQLFLSPDPLHGVLKMADHILAFMMMYRSFISGFTCIKPQMHVIMIPKDVH